MSVQAFRKKFIGNKAFYTMVLGIVIPMVIQNTITNFVSLLDNIMVGQIGTEQMSGVAIANQLMFVYNLCIFGGHGGAGIFTAQFHGKADNDGIRYTMRFKMILSIVLTTGAILLFSFFDAPLIGLFLHDGSATGNLELTLFSGQEYLKIMLLGLIPFSVSQVYTGTLREVGETKVPMVAGIVAVFVNLFLNWVLIYGKLGMPAMGVVGAAVATVASRIVECVIVVVWLHRHSDRFPFAKKVWRSLGLPAYLVGDIFRKGMPLLVNEALWSFSMTAINQCYSTRGLAVVAAMNISSTIANLFNVIYMSLGNAVGIIVGRQLGQGRTRDAIDTDNKLIAFGIGVSMLIGGTLAITSGLFPSLYNTTGEVRELAAYFICVAGLLMPMHSFLHCAYFTLRCGGRTLIVFMFDCMFICLVNLPIAYVLAHFTTLEIHYMYLVCQLVDLIKCVIGFVLLKKKIWVNNIVGGVMDEE